VRATAAPLLRRSVQLFGGSVSLDIELGGVCNRVIGRSDRARVDITIILPSHEPKLFTSLQPRHKEVSVIRPV
jgi:hypothetical protein